MSLPFSFHQAIMESRKEKTVRLAERKKKDPTHRVSPIPGTAEVAFQREAYICRQRLEVICHILSRLIT